MEEELMLTDLVSIAARLEKLEKDLKKGKTPEGEKERELLILFRAALEQGKPIRELELPQAEEKLVRSFAFLSQKPILHAVNCGEAEIAMVENPGKYFPEKKPGIEILAFCGKIEAEISELEDEERRVFLAEYGLSELSAARFFREMPRILGTIFFFTVGKNEVRAWIIPRLSTAGQAAGAIHTDIERGFIRAEVIAWQNLVDLGSLQAAKDKGLIRLEGKEYAVQDGDVVYFRFAS
jgi:ribosome-binding ATPase YchF (GTP1/OBG family)